MNVFLLSITLGVNAEGLNRAVDMPSLCYEGMESYYSSLPRFSAMNAQGLELWYGKLTDSTVMITGSISNSAFHNPDKDNYSYITADTIIVPEKVQHSDTTYTVVQTNPYGVFNNVSSLTTVYLPKTIALIGDTVRYTEMWGYDDCADSDGDCNFGFVQSSNLQKVHIDAENPYYVSIDGIVYTKDMKDLVLYPRGRKETKYNPIEGCQRIQRAAFYGANSLQEVELPNSVKSVGHYAFHGCTCKTIILKDSVEMIGVHAIGRFVEDLHIGAQLKVVPYHGIRWADIKAIHSYALVPPTVTMSWTVNQDTKVYVPRNSISAYRNAPVWEKYNDFYPIEPPIVAGVDEATVSWVQNFSATGYVWTLYSDEAHTQMVMTLTFDQRGYLTSIVLGNAASAPQRALAQAVADDEGSGNSGSNGNGGDDNGAGSDSDGEKRFAEYYSFTISSLNRNTTYYYTRQSLSDDQVIDEESGTFATSDKTATDVDAAPATDGTSSAALKVISNGQVYILRDGKVYDMTGKTAPTHP